jgi:hypothetical protein
MQAIGEPDTSRSLMLHIHVCHAIPEVSCRFYDPQAFAECTASVDPKAVVHLKAGLGGMNASRCYCFAEPDGRSTDRREISSWCMLALISRQRTLTSRLAMTMAIVDVVNCWDSTSVHAAAHATPPSHVRLCKMAMANERCYQTPNVSSSRVKRPKLIGVASRENITVVHFPIKYPSRPDTITITRPLR